MKYLPLTPSNRGPTKTLEGISIIRDEVIKAFKAEIDRDLCERNIYAVDILNSWLEEIGSENPKLIEFMKDITDKYPPELQGAMIYKIIKSQAIADRVWNFLGAGMS